MPAKDLRNDVISAALAFCDGKEDDHRLQIAVQRYREAKQIKFLARRNAAYRRGRKALIVAMGGKCSLCPRRSKLEFDHPHGRDWSPSRTSRWVRLARYKREWSAGLIRLLCRSCNASKKNHPKLVEESHS